jgi:hypothetical protein
VGNNKHGKIAWARKIIEAIGGGNFGKTYLAEDILLPNRDRCVVKHLQPQQKDLFTLKVGRDLFEYDLTLQYPASWKLETKEDFMGTIATFIPDRDIPTQVKINVENLTRSMNLDEYTTSAVAEIKENNIEMKYRQTWFIEGDRVYIMTYEAKADKYDDYLRSVEEVMVKSFTVN